MTLAPLRQIGTLPDEDTIFVLSKKKEKKKLGRRNEGFRNLL
jgi:hypothetical protein